MTFFPPLRILFTNATLSLRRGTELYIYDIVTHFRNLGHHVEVYSPEFGEVAEDLLQLGVRVVNSVEQIDFKPDIIHAQHNGPTMAVSARFPETPIVYVCHGTAPIDEQLPPRIPQILQYVAVSAPTAEMLEFRCGVPAERISIVPNFVDAQRYPSRARLNVIPERALCFSNYLTFHSGADILRRVVSRHGMIFDLVGFNSGNPIRYPEEILGTYDLVFARGRSALEAMAAGCAVVLCDIEGIGPMVTDSNFDFLRRKNFGAAAFNALINEAAVKQQISRYDVSDARRVSQRVKNEAHIGNALKTLHEIYCRTIEESSRGAIELSAEARAIQNARLFEWLVIDSRKEVKSQLEYWKAQAEIRTAELQRVQDSSFWKVYRLLSKFDPLISSLFRKWHNARCLVSSVVSSDMRDTSPKRSLAAIPVPSVENAGDAQLANSQLACVVMSYNDDPWVVAAVQSLQNQEHVRVEIVVVNSGLCGTAERLKRHGIDVLVIESPDRLFPGAARNIGIAASKAPYISFLAADCLAEPNWAAERIRAHRRGALGVSSAITNPYGDKLSAWASYAILFSKRLPCLKEKHVLHYGVSYERRIFDAFGLFREDLRAGEDTEFNERIAPSISFCWEPGVRTAHRHPRSVIALLKDNYRRGALSARTYSQLRNRDGRKVVAKSALHRLPETLALALQGVDAAYRLRIILAFPLIALGLLTYSAAALFGKATIEQAAGTSSAVLKRRRKILALLVCRNELHQLPDYIANIAPQVDGIVALDDGSSDGSAEFLQNCPAVLHVIRKEADDMHVWDEPRNQREIINAALCYSPDWLVAIDADERVEQAFRILVEQELDKAERGDLNVCCLHLRELWNAPDRFRADGIWKHKRIARLFKAGPLSNFQAPQLHGSWASHVHENTEKKHFADIVIYHLAMIDPESRQRRKDKYKQLDPERKFQARGYDYLTDERSLRLQSIEASRYFYPYSIFPKAIHNERLAQSSVRSVTVVK